MELLIRDVTQADAAAIAEIYGFHVLHGTASYDLEAPPEEFHRDKVNRVTAAGWPFLVAELQGEVVGYAYVTQFRDRAAYRFTAEDSIYVHPEKLRLGIGKMLLETLIDRSVAYGFRTIIAVIGGSEPGSVALHQACDFREAGRMRGVGFKFGRWLDSVYMQRDLFCAPLSGD